MKNIMIKKTTLMTLTLFVTTFVFCSLLPNSANALPIFSRRYNIPCSTCHAGPPKLNKMGWAFLANHYNWPTNTPPAYHTGLKSVPVSALISSNRFEAQGAPMVTAYQATELFTAGGINFTSEKKGGYWLDYFVLTNNNTRASDLDGAWVALPVAGNSGEVSVAVGQFSPLEYQWDGVSNVTSSMPAPLDTGTDGVTFDSAQPGIRLEYYDHRHRMTANGNYVNIGIPFDGHLTFNKDSMVDGPHGVYLHAFKRVGFTTGGVLLYTHDNFHYGSFIGTRNIAKNFYLLGVAALSHDPNNGEQKFLSGQVDYTVNPFLTLSGRYESITGANSEAYPVFAVSWYPIRSYWLRLTAESVQLKSNRTNTYGLFIAL